jgi:ATP-dependent Clp protease ATP-binding subunit ClpX
MAGVPPKGGRKHPEQSLININTKNILFICGGAFEGLEKIVARRVSQNPMGFGATIRGKKDIIADEFLPLVEPDDLLKFGLIPEFIGRLHVIASLHSLDGSALLSILTQPKNALVKQYQKLFRLENVELEFEQEALDSIVSRAIERRTGARALRSIMEETMLDIMYHLPSRQNVTRCVITKDTIQKMKEPNYITKERKASA